MILLIPKLIWMPRQKRDADRLAHFFYGMMAIASALILFSATPGWGAEQATFSSPESAVSALISALKDNDDAALLNILGPNSEELIFSGDKIADQNGKARF